MRFVLGVETSDWAIESTESGFYDGVKVLHFHLKYIGKPRLCPECKEPLIIKDYKEREWRHENLGETVCYIHAKVPRCKCENAVPSDRWKCLGQSPRSLTCAQCA